MSELNGTADVEGYRIIRPIQTPASEVGQPCAHIFDYGNVRSQDFGEARLSGKYLSTSPFEDSSLIKRNVETEDPSVWFRQLPASIMDEAESVGYAKNGDTTLFDRLRSTCSFLHDVYIANHADTDIQNSKLTFLICILGEILDDTLESRRERGLDLKCLLRLHKAALGGTLIHLDQVPSLPSDLRQCTTMLILTRKEGLKRSSGAWPHLEQDVLRTLHGMYKEDKVDTSAVEDYCRLRAFSSAAGMFFEADWIVRGIRVSDQVRNDPDFHSFKYMTSLQCGLLNDVLGLQQEMKAGDHSNIVLILAKAMSLEAAIGKSLRLTDLKLFEAKAAARGLLRTFPNNESVKEMVRATFRLANSLHVVMESLQSRYGLVQKSTYHVVEYNKEYVAKEEELAEYLKITTHNPPRNDTELEQVLSELREKTNDNVY